ncbi:MAG: insulinase family protein [Oscillospiraceae bacterium]|nr:insulinase family protein [Oscillospiraceae bacterium]
MSELFHGFAETRVRELSEIDAKLHEMKHVKSGARLIWIEREDDNKTFGIAFKTLPENDTGVFHILEHSVLNGSDRYPVKEPFVELLKNSMNTFLNAMTYPDKTVYPVSSKNNQDFINLMRVYLDAVFHPLIYSKPEIFYQEGWHHEFAEDGTVSYKGVVFNEMKGATSDPDDILEEAVMQGLFPDNCYKHNSGGAPASIPDLTYEMFIANHKKYYDPSNSYIFIDGSVDIDTTLGIIDDEYLSHYDAAPEIPPIDMQKPIDGGVLEYVYGLSPSEELEGHTRLAYGNVIGTYDEYEKLIAMDVLAEVLAGTNHSPLSRAILSEGLAEDVIFRISDGILQPYAVIEIRNLKDENKDKVEKLVRDTLTGIADNGVDREQLESSMANLEFKLREKNYGPKGLVFGLTALGTWLYGGDPATKLVVGDMFENLKKKADEGYFEQLIRDVLLDNKHTCKVVLKPSHTYAETTAEKEQARLKREEKSWTSEEREALIEKQKKLEAWQHREDTPENLATLPMLKLSDLPDEPEKFPMEEAEIGGMKVLLHKLNTSGIVYTNLYFDATDLSEKELSAASLLCSLLGKLDTKSHSAEKLQTLLNFYCGSFGAKVSAYPSADNYDVKFVVSFSALETKLEDATKLVCEILSETKLDSETSVMEILRQEKTDVFQSILMRGNSAALGRVNAQISPAGVVGEYTSGISYYKTLGEFESESKSLLSALGSVKNKVLGSDRAIVSITGEMAKAAETVVDCVSSTLPAVGKSASKADLKPFGVKKEGIAVPTEIAFAAMGSSVAALGEKVTGEYSVAARILTYGYLWNVIRVQGGAYGTGFVVRDSGYITCHSYRDPSANRSLGYFKKSGEFLRDFLKNNDDLTGFIIGSVSDMFQLTTPSMKGVISDNRYFTGITPERVNEKYHELIGATPEKLTELSYNIDKVICDGGICIVGSKKQLDECEELDSVETL